MAQEIEVKDIRLYNRLNESPTGQAYALILDGSDDTVKLLNVDNLTDGVSTIPNWSSAPPPPYENGYPFDFVVRYTDKIWASNIADNLNNPPVAGGSEWTEVSASATPYLRYPVGGATFTSNATMVSKENSLYLLDKDVVLPFNSTDFDAELSAGTWVVVGSSDYAEITREPSGFRYPDDTIVSYDSISRTITLTGNVEAYYQGSKVAALVSGWVSDAHDVADGTYFLSYNGAAFVWSTTLWTFDVVMIALVYIDEASFCLRECHGLMQWQAHQEFHNTIGTYVGSGGDFSNYTLDSETPADRRPDIAQTTVFDEDLKTVLDSLTTGLYSQLTLTGANTANITTDNADIVPLSGSNPYYNLFTGGAWTQALISNRDYAKIFVLGIPVTADVECQKRRFVFVQPQYSGNKNDVIAINSGSVNLGHISGALAEYVYFAEIIIRYKGGDWTITELNKLTGNRVMQSNSPAGNYLSSVTTGDEFTGDGSLTSPLYFLGKIYNAARTFYNQIVSNATANRTLTLQDKSGINAHIYDDGSYKYTFNESTTVVEPSSREFSFNSATPSAVTEMRLSGKCGGAADGLIFAKFIGDLQDNSWITVQSYDYDGNARNYTYRVDGDITFTPANFGYIVPVKFRAGASDSMADKGGRVHWFGFHQAAGGSGTIIEADTTEPFDPLNVAEDGFLGYRAGSYVSYINEASIDPDPLFQENYLYVSLVDIAQGVSPEDDQVNWDRIGQSIEVVSSTSSFYVSNITELRAVTNYKNGHDVTVGTEQLIYSFSTTATSGIKPFDLGEGYWIVKRHISLTNLTRIYNSTDEDSITLYHGKSALVFRTNFVIDIEDPTTGDTEYALNIPNPALVTKTGAGFTAADFTIDYFGGATPIDEQVLPALRFEKDRTSTKAQALSTVGGLSLSLAPTPSPINANINTFFINADGVGAVNLTTDFDLISTIPSDLNGKVLDLGLYRAMAAYFTDGIAINIINAGGAVAPPITVPIVTTQAVSAITDIAATGNGNITDLGGENATAHGFVWATTTEPTLSDSSVDNGIATNVGSFIGSITGLTDGLTYYVRAFATNSAGTSYGNEVSFLAEAPETAIMSFQTDYNGTYQPQITPTTGILKWEVDGVIQTTNTPSFILSGSVVDVKVYANDAIAGVDTSVSMLALNGIGSLDYDYFKINGTFRITGNSGLTGIIYSTYANTSSFFDISANNLSTQDYTNMQFTGPIAGASNPNLETPIFGTGASSCTSFKFYQCKFVNDLILTSFTSMSGPFEVYNNVGLQAITFGTGTYSSTSFRVQNCSILSIDLSNHTLTGVLYLYNNNNLATVTMGANAHSLSQVYVYNTAITTIDLSNTTISSWLNLSGNASMTNFGMPSWTTGLAIVNITNSAANTATVDALLSSLNTYFSLNAPTKNLQCSMSGGTVGSPTAGDSNTDLVNLRDVVFPNAGFTFNYTIN